MKLPDGFTYEEATNEDTSKAKNLIFKILEEFGLSDKESDQDSDLDDLEENFKDGFFGLVKSPENQIIATFALYKLNETSIEIRKMYLLSEFRSKGIGKWMLNFLIHKAKQLGYNKIELQTASVLHSAIAMYRKTGFDEVTSSSASPRCDRAFEMYL